MFVWLIKYLHVRFEKSNITLSFLIHKITETIYLSNSKFQESSISCETPVVDCK